MDVTGYRCVDAFISTLAGTRGLAAAFELGLIDLLLEEKETSADLLADRLGIDRQGMGLLLGILLASDVVAVRDGNYSFTEAFSQALQYRDLIEVKARFSNLCALDFISHFTSLVKDLDVFMDSAQLFKLFDYGHAVSQVDDNLEKTKAWVDITTTLTKYEAGVVMDYHDFSRYGRILDIGGNSGELVLRLCRKHPRLTGTVFDLPVVCEIGRRHLAGTPEAAKIDFIAGDALSDPLPSPYDVVTFKSFLHDWPDASAAAFIERAAASLVPGGIMLIFERGPLDFTGRDIPFHLVPYLLFARFFRTPALYVRELAALGFADVIVKAVELETPFYLVTGVKCQK